MRFKGHIPGEAGVWVLILGDLLIFTAFFLTFMSYRSAEPDVFARSHAELNRGLGLANTILLVTSSLFVALGVHQARRECHLAPRLFLGAMACGAGFVMIKILEYGEKIAAGITVTTNMFYMLYFAFTGGHLFHVLLGMGVLAYVTAVSGRKAPVGGRMMVIESGASFWHLVDLLWIVLFSMLYLLG